MAVSAAGVNTTAVTTTSVTGSRNEKGDFTPVYTPPEITAPTSVFVDADTEFSFSAVGGASSYTHDGTPTNEDVFTYQVVDSVGGTSTAMVHITGNPVAQPLEVWSINMGRIEGDQLEFLL